ncbi:hypothetical protein FIBSPDRAFT_939100 [Athelia psychrophila]|uniref:Transmembrane protein n=1 Tax=Athelia psychrophila TaxID=1759441 RepID=A0A167X6Z4_9AGAM|nr:hypothetical protein FIBSPDRAFT_1053269 [Fibularhizoctonia sp. CBS 109695]KZP06891.1 hypothetical protein FIBSPDRAFT_1053271 [Fibularhizoctonia sp. CBS 109695]KZP08186.1 hypothetical protein FIBSPDRAFT_939100 [Fibularhizoctonia sp. CBS 109695]
MTSHRLPELEKKMDSAKAAVSELGRPVKSSSGWRMPSQNAKTMVLGTTLVGAGFILFFANLHRRQAIKERKDIANPGTIPTWQFRLKQAGSPGNEDGSGNGSRRIHTSLGTPLPAPVREHNARHITFANYDGPENERYMVPSPQRSRGDGSHRAYTKTPSYLDNYEKTTEHHKRMKLGKKTRLAQDEEFEESTG